MSRFLFLAGLGLLMLMALPSRSLAAIATLHYFDCKQCHKAGMAITAMGANNVCLECHSTTGTFTDSTPAPAAWYDGIPNARYNALADQNDLFGAASAVLGAGSYTGQSHGWGVSDVRAAAGAKAPDKTNPLYAGFYSRYNASTGKVTCSRCHNPHGDADLGEGNILANPKLLIRDALNSNAPMQPEVMCRACHVDLDKSDSLTINTHPMVTDYAAAQAASPNDLRTQAEIDTFTGGHSSKVQLSNGGVGCVSCHGVHYTDSDATTADGLANRTGLLNSPGELLRSDGAHRTGPSRNAAGTGTAQLRSNLCQSCHKYELHGQGLSGDHKLGCLDCHNGHDPVGNTSDYMLRSASNGAVPTRPNGTNGASANITFNAFTAGDPRLNWADDIGGGSANGFCEKCHGDVNSGTIGAKAAEHLPGNGNQCNVCHKHNDPANQYSFNRDASAATCGQCHGFPPYLNSPGDRPPGGTGVDGGYAVNKSTDPNTPYDYVTSTTHEKDESTTGHKVHAGRDLPLSPANTLATDWYFVGSAGIDNCKVCHGPDAGSSAGGHREAPATRPNTFRDVPFDGIAKHGGMNPAYNINSPYTCSNVYCHTNGAPYSGASRPNRVYTFVNVTPPWVGNGSNYAAGGYGSIHTQANECAACHGNTATTMGAGQKQNSAAHLAHLGGATTLNMGKTFSCSVCHVQSAASSTALAVNAMDGRTGGKHVNGDIDVNFDGTGFNTELTTSTYTASTGVCATYCHNVASQGGEVTADWDNGTDMQCDSCHGGLASDSSGNGGAGPISTGSHARHISSATGPTLACAECHGTGSDAGTHAGHLDGVVNMKPPVDGVAFADICQECHGYDAEAGEVLPVWGSPATTDCATCHAGIKCGADLEGKAPPVFNFARSAGHNRPTASGAYPVSGNVAANSNCADCHVTTSAQHWDGTSGNTAMLRTDVGFPATYAGNENAFCGNCHGSAPAHPTKAASVATRNINSHQGKLCIACHNLHGTSNIQMIIASQTEQNSNDITAGAYTGTVAFTALTGDNSYDEDDGAAGSAGELNADDLCATCHTSAAGTSHNNNNNTDSQAPTGHNIGSNCFTCHATHTDSTNAFKVGVGTACNACHDFPPATGAHRKGTALTDPELHSNTASNDKDVEDRTDCAWCHTGADQYTYDLTADQAAGGARGNHAKGQTNRRSVLATAVGYETTNFSCATACHASSASDGAWTDVNGLNCNACHYAAASPTGASNNAAGTRAVSATHNKHFDKNNMTCAQCHDVSYSPTITAIRGVLTHIIAPNYSGAGNDGILLQGRANATLDEATVTRSGMVYSGGAADAGGPNNTCTGGITTGCHASGTPDWDVAIPATSAGCVMCHTETNTAAYNPTSGIHDNSPSGPTVTGNSHDGSFDNGSGGTADCVTCHSTSPNTTPTNHINGVLNTGSAITVAAIAGYNQPAGTCATTCHSAGTTWSYKWSTTAYNTNGTECANCHGDYTSGWNTGVAPHTENPTRGTKHNNVGNLTYPCSDCHAIGSAGYKWTSKWDPTGTNSNHGDDKITMNQVAGTNTFAIDTVPNPDRAGCTTTSCHSNDAAHTFRVTTTSLTTQTVTGNAPDVSCSGCHGGYVGTNANGYWPDGPNTAGDNTSEDNSGAHFKHMEVLAKAKYNETIAQLLTNNGNGTADAKQKFLCAYCHGTASGNPMDATHGQTSYLPADVTRMYAMWDLTQSSVDSNASYDGVTNRTCATVDCHNNKTTPTSPTNFSWYGGATSACIMCHVDVTDGSVASSNGGTHVAHTSAATNFGRTITCNDCHKTASETVAWGSPGTPPTNNHLNGTFTVSSNVVTFTYSAGQGCGTNVCHNAGDGVTAPASGANSYPWGTALANCSICHIASPTSAAHTKHLAAKVSSYVSGSCADCHANSTTTQITASTHIDGTRNAGGGSSKITAAPGNGSCTNSCHLSAEAGDWTGGSAAIACADCHSGSGASAYIGGDKTSVSGPNYMPQYNMHVLTPTVSGKKHDGTLTACTTCHTTISAQATHVNGTWTADDADNTNDQHRGLFATYTDAASGGSCSGSGVACHADGGSWTRKWKSTVTATNGAECANCHGDYASGWNAGVGHAVSPTRGNSSNHNSTGSLSYACTACHVIGASTNAYPWTTGSNDWKATDAGATTLHGDGKLTINNTSTSHSRNENPVGTWKSGCAGCHDGPSNDGVGSNDGLHDFPVNIATAPSTVRWALQPASGDAASTGGGCDGCHGGGGSFAPNGSRGNVYPDRPGKHAEHMAALTAKGITGAEACNYCHPYSSGSSYVVGEHNDNVAPATMPNATSNYFRRIIGGANDSNGITNGSGTSYVTCSNVDCHFDMPRTPHWYTDDVKPETVTLTAVAGPNPRSIKVSWNAPGDDAGVDDTTPYVYDLRMGTSSAIATNFISTTNYAPVPMTYKRGAATEVVVENLTPAQGLYFGLRTKDTAGNWSDPSVTAAAVTPTVDTQAPDFGGVSKAEKGDSSQTVYLTWEPAEDHTMPITYKVWMKNESAGALNMSVDTPLLTGVKGHSIQLTAADGLVNDEIYQFGVRACDALNNCDTNTQVVSATPTAEPTVSKTNHVYRANAAASGGYVGMEKDAAFSSASTSALPVTFRPAANLTYPVLYMVDSFNCYITNGNATSVIRATLGTSTGANFTAFTAPTMSVDVTMGARAKGIKTFKFGDVAGRQVASGQRIAIQLTLVSGTVTSIGWGSAANGGAMTLSERIVNAAPLNPNLSLTSNTNGTITVGWQNNGDGSDGVADTVHYDLYGSDDNGTTYRYLLAKNLAATTTSYAWITQEDGIAGSATMAVKLLPGDGYTHYTGAGTTLTGLAVNNTNDNVAPGAITDLVASPRPKSGSVVLTWTAQGDDDYNNGRAKYYEIRYSTSAITEGNFNSATLCTNVPTPDFGGRVQKYEVTGLTPGQTYYFAIKTFDDGTPAKSSPISTAKAVGTDQTVGGPRCGMCHTTGPSIVESAGNHKLHGITIANCTKCHGSAVASYGLDHQDGVLKMGYGPGGPQAPIISGNRIYYTDNGLAGGTVMYDDTDGFGGFGNGSYANVGDAIDDGSCINFGALGVGGCHSGAGTDPDGAGSLFATLPTPTWTSAAYLNCAACHGNPSRTVDAYGRAFDSGLTDQVKAAPTMDNHGNWDPAGATEQSRKYIGQHEKHLNYSYRFSKGDNCNLCHAGDYRDVNNLDGKHANGDVDVKLDLVAAGPNATWAPGTATTAGTCSNMSPESCHPSTATPKWDSNVSFDCVQCHGFAGVTPSHVTDPNAGVSAANNGWATDPMPGNCTYCHFGGHPRDTVGGTALILANSSQVGINYKSGGIHMKASIGGRAARATEAELCWQCHDANGISEWGTDTGANNTVIRPPNNNDYNFGTIALTAGGAAISNWLGDGSGAFWRSGNANFGYKEARIKSTHSTSPTGTSAVTSDRFRTHTETLDTLANIRCSNCHDVHNLNKAPGDNVTGKPYLRGTWLSNPYKEDGAPRSGMSYTSQNAYGQVPRGGTAYVQDGGYFIDQNSGNPTAGYGLATSAGLCTLCHGSNVDGMDKATGENLWLGTNGHSNSAIGGTAQYKVNIFDTGTGVAGGYGTYSGRPTPVAATARADEKATVIPNMGYMIQYGYEGHGYRGAESGTTYNGSYTPATNPAARAYAFNAFDWGVSVDASTIDVGFHAFSCSKCHNPHASRLPKLMITNCLDVKQNTWDDGNTSQTLYTSANNTDQGKKTASYDSAQNCHRFNFKFTVTATNISFPSTTTIQSGTAIFTGANGYKVGDRVKITGGVNNGKVGTIQSLTTTVLTLNSITDASGGSTTLTTAGTGTSITLEGARGGWNKITPW